MRHNDPTVTASSPWAQQWKLVVIKKTSNYLAAVNRVDILRRTDDRELKVETKSEFFAF